jgi:EmrB/QacA subfamily drug resistance transporter
MANTRAQARFWNGWDPRWLALSVTTIGSFMSILDSTIVNVALPSILRDFGAGLQTGQLVLTVYLLTLAVVVPLSGYLAGRAGIKRLYIITLFFFTAGSALCGLAWNLPSLIVFRAIQGLGGGMLQPLGMALVFTMITPLERGRYMGMLGLPMLLAPLLGPTLGGYLAQYVSWRMIFLINLPIGVANLGLAWALLKEQPRQEGLRFDGLGFLLALCAFPSLLLALSEGGQLGWTSPATLTLMGAGIAALVAFIIVELRKRQPLLHVRLFERPMFALAMAINFVTQFSLFGIQFLMPLLLQQARGLGAAATGLLLFPSGITSFIAMNVSGRLYNRVGPKRLALAGLAVLFVTTAALGRTTEATGLLVIGFLASLRGVAMGLCMMPVQTAAYNTVPQEQIAHATALSNVLFRIFGSAGTAILTATLVFSLTVQGAPAGATVTSGTAPVHMLESAFDSAFLLMAAVTLIGMALAWFLRDPVLEGLREQPAPVPGERTALAAE